MIARSEVGLAAEPDTRSRRRTVGVAIIALLAMVATVMQLLAVRHHVTAPLAGDEPHYLLVTNSLITDGDVDVKNDYTNKRYLAYYPYLIDPHVNTRIFTPASPHWYSMHGVGLSALLVPAVVLDDTAGAKIAMVVIAAVVLLLTFLWARRFSGEAFYAAIATGALGVSPFFLGLEGRIFTDLLTAALLLGCLLILELSGRRAWHLLLLGGLIGLSPWFHFKNGLPFGLIAVIAFISVARSTTGSGRIRGLALLTVPVLVSVIGYELSIHAWYGSWLPTRMMQPGPELFSISPTRGIAAASFDSARGLLANNPALMLILAGLPVWMIRSRQPFLRFAAVIGPTILVEATFNNWHGGYAPPGRYELQFTPAFVPAIALFLRDASRSARALGSVVLAVQGALAAAFVWLHPVWAIEGQPSPFLTKLDRRVGIGLDHAMPTFDPRASLVRGGWQLAAWVIASGALVAYGAVLAHRAIVRRELR